MSVLEWLRKAFGYVLLSMGVSRPAPRAAPARAAPAAPEGGKLGQDKSNPEKP